MAYQAMTQTQKEADDAMKQLGEYSKQMSQIMSKISSLQFDKVDYETILDIMRQVSSIAPGLQHVRVLLMEAYVSFLCTVTLDIHVIRITSVFTAFCHSFHD